MIERHEDHDGTEEQQDQAGDQPWPFERVLGADQEPLAASSLGGFFPGPPKSFG